jgi:5'-methylthioadenosine phosphorylase
LRKAEIAIIGGTGQEKLLNYTEQTINGTPYGLSPPIFMGEIYGKTVAFMPRHGVHHGVPPHKVNYRANIYALRHIGVKRILATNAVGAINQNIKPSDLVVPHDLVDFTKSRQSTFYDDEPVTHVDVSQIFCPETRATIIRTAKEIGVRVVDHAILVCTEGPRLETPAEIRMFRRMGCDVVGMTVMPEAVLARELEMCYANVCFVTNMAAGMQKRLTAEELVKVAKKTAPILQQLLRETVKHLPTKRQCQCAHTLEKARFRV